MKINNIKKKIKKIVIVLMILVVILVIILFIINILKNKMRSFYDISENIIVNETYNNSFNRVTIKSVLSDIYIKNSLDNTSKIIVYGNKDLVSHNIKNNKLYINIQEKKCVGMCIKNEVSKIEIYLPNEYSNVIDITNKYGNIEIEKFDSASFDIKEEFGDIKLEYSKFSKIESNDGNLILGNGKIVRLDTTKVDININEVDDIKIDSDHGNVKINKINNYLDIKNEYGDTLIKDITLDKNSRIDIEYGDITINSIKDIYIKAKTDLGDLKIKNNNKKSDIILEIESDCGNIKVN